MAFYSCIETLIFTKFYFVLLARFPRGQLQPVVFSSSCYLRSLAIIPLKFYTVTLKLFIIHFVLYLRCLC
ncbi:hypothetical protein BUZ08_13200 [Staphylococcus gallinarum]|nr:hypothetical protein BUZ08_13200 [Staphylococcus gallinarum]RIO78033.1 hypothetical protein BUZ07_10915 [Staphylococcus gallinarum]